MSSSSSMIFLFCMLFFSVFYVLIREPDNTFILYCTLMYMKETSVWSTIKKYLEDYPERLKVARVLIENGMSVKDNRIYLNQIEIPSVRIAKVAGVDRRTVNETLNAINANREPNTIFE